MAEVAETAVSEPTLRNAGWGDLPHLAGTLHVMAIPTAGRGLEQDAIGILDLQTDPSPLRFSRRMTICPPRYGTSRFSMVSLEFTWALVDELSVTLTDKPA